MRPTTQEELRYRRAKEEIKAQSERNATQSLPELEWNFFPQKVQTPPDWQLNHWLNYEYARSCQEIKKAVNELRVRTVEERDAGTYPAQFQGPTFAVYLNKYYPEFPDTPWLMLPEARRGRRILEIAGNDLSNPFEQNILKNYDPVVFSDQIQTGELNLRGGQWPDPQKEVWLGGILSPDPGELNDEAFAIFEINFKYTDKQIVKKFSEWLAARRKFLNAQFKNSRVQKNLTPSPQTSSRGRHANRRVYLGFLKQLAALRLMNYCNQDYFRCAEISARPNGKPLYAEEQTSWVRAQNKAKNLMGRFGIAWRHAYLPPFILNPEDFKGTLSVRLAAPFPS